MKYRGAQEDHASGTHQPHRLVSHVGLNLNSQSLVLEDAAAGCEEYMMREQAYDPYKMTQRITFRNGLGMACQGCQPCLSPPLRLSMSAQKNGDNQ